MEDEETGRARRETRAERRAELRPQSALAAADRSKLNAQLASDGHADKIVALCRWPKRPDGRQLLKLTIVKLPRTSASKPPRRGVEIPPSIFSVPGLQKVSKHAGQKQRRSGFGKKGDATIAAKAELQRSGHQEAIGDADEKRIARAKAPGRLAKFFGGIKRKISRAIFGGPELQAPTLRA